MAIVLQSSAHTTVSAGGSTTKNVSLTVHASADFLVIKHMSYQGDGSGEGITSMSWNGSALTLGARSDGSLTTHEWASIWYLAAPTTGSQTLAIVYNAAGNPYGSDVVAEYWSGVDPAIGSSDGHYIDTGSPTSDSLSIGVTAGGVTTDAIYVNAGSTITPGSGQTTVYEGADIGTAERICASYEAGETTPSNTFGASSRVAHAAMELKAAAGAASPLSVIANN